MLLKFKLKGGVLVETEIMPKEIAKWINAHPLEDRIQVFRDINLNYESKDQLKKIFKKISDDLIDADLTESEMFIVLITLDALAEKMKKRIKKRIKKSIK